MLSSKGADFSKVLKRYDIDLQVEATPEEMAKKMLPTDPVFNKVAEEVMFMRFKTVGPVVAEAIKERDPLDVINNGLVAGMEVVAKLYAEKPPNDFKVWLAEEWKNIPNVLTVNRTATLTGYHKNTIQKWIYHKKLKALNTQNLLIIPKEWLIDYYCCVAYAIQRKSQKHLDLLKKYYNQIETR